VDLGADPRRMSQLPGAFHRSALTCRTAVIAAATAGERCSPSRTIRTLCRTPLLDRTSIALDADLIVEIAPHAA
jgi:hypothetical protein